MRPLPTFRQLLVLLVLGALLPMAALALGLVAYEYQRDRAHVEREALATARALMALTEDRYEGLQRAQESLLQQPIESAWLQELLARQRLPATWIAAILDRTGRIVARTHEPERFVGKSARPELLARIAEVPEGAVESMTLEGVPVVSAFSRSDRTGWSVVVGMPRDELRRPLLRGTVVLFAGAAAVLLLSLALAWRLSRTLGASLEALGVAVRATAHRARVQLPPPAFLEARELGQALLHADAALEDAALAQRRAEARLQGVLDAAMDGIVMADAQGRIVLFNTAAEAVFRLPQEDAIGRPLEDLVPERLRAQHRMQRVQLTPDTVGLMAPGRRITCLRGDGSTLQAEASISVNGEGEERLYTAILRPVIE